MLPLTDVIPPRTRPWVTYAVVAISVLVFLGQMVAGRDHGESAAFQYGLVPGTFSWTRLVASMFMHANVVHLVANMAALWLFGENVEDRMGHDRFAVFYVVIGIIAAFTHAVTAADVHVPVVGSSGAVAGVIGAYLVLFPRSRILVLRWWRDVVEVPAIVVQVAWVFVMPIVSVRELAGTIAGANLGLWGHVAGFLAGALGVLVFRRPERQRVEWWSRTRQKAEGTNGS